MAVSFVGANSADSTTVNLPSGTAVGDLAVVVAGRTNTAGPSIPSGWTDEGVVSGGSGGTAHGSRLGWKILTQADIDAGNVGTWTNASQIGVSVFRGASQFKRNGVAGVGASGTTVTFPAQSGLAAGSWQAALGTHRASGSPNNLKSGTMTNYTNRSSGLTSINVGLWDSNGTTSGIGQRTVTTSGSSGNAGWTGEIVEAPLIPPLVVSPYRPAGWNNG
jgi:hypothetical protein